ncbi:ankyrin [Lactarius indigo]|nr:ankyrin [Lactarius indigo]
MAEKDTSARLRKAVRENNLFLVKRLIQRIDMRNPDPGPKRYTSLAWAVVEGNEDMFDFLLREGHDEEELSRDSENSTILILLADIKPPSTGLYASSDPDFIGSVLRMARTYYDRYPFILDWSDSSGRTALHVAALKGNEELVRMLCDLGADYDLPDNQGNTPLHNASAWGHIPIVQLLIERGCQFAAKNDSGYSPSDYAYSYSVRDTLESTARAQVEHNKRARRVFAQAAARGAELDGYETSVKDLGLKDSMRNRTESRPLPFTTHTVLAHPRAARVHSRLPCLLPPIPIPAYLPPLIRHPALSPIASRVRKHDANAMEAYLRRNRSGSGSTDAKMVEFPSPAGSSQVSSGPSVNGDNIASLPNVRGSVAPRRRLRPSSSAAQLRNHTKPPFIDIAQRNRAGTNPTTRLPSSPRSPLSDTFVPVSPAGRGLPSRNSSLNALSTSNDDAESERFVGPSSDYAVFPDPPEEDLSPTVTPTVTNTPTSRRLPFNILSKPLPSIDLHHGHGHRRGSSYSLSALT